MKSAQTTSQSTEQLQDDIEAAVGAGQDIKEKVRRITVKALTEGDLDRESIRQVTEAVVKGAGLGAIDQGIATKEILDKAVSGLDEALSKAAEASKLAMKEAAGRGEEFSENELKRTLNDLQGLESLFLETLRDSANAGKAQTSAILHELADHAQYSGTAVGEQLKEGLTGLVGAASDVGKNQFESGVEAVKTTSSLFTKLAIGMLEGIADSMDSSSGVAGESKQQRKDKVD